MKIEKVDEVINFCNIKYDDLLKEFCILQRKIKISNTPVLKFKNEKKLQEIESNIYKNIKKIKFGKKIRRNLYYMKFYFEDILKNQLYKNIPTLQYNSYDLHIDIPDEYVIGFYNIFKGKTGPVLWVEKNNKFTLRSLFDNLKSNDIYSPFERPKCRAIVLHKHTLMYVLIKEFSLRSRVLGKKFQDVNNNIFKYVKK